MADKIRAASAGAAALVSHIELAHKREVTDADFQPISDIQHYLMENMKLMKQDEADEKIDALLLEMRALDEKFSTPHEY